MSKATIFLETVDYLSDMPILFLNVNNIFVVQNLKMASKKANILQHTKGFSPDILPVNYTGLVLAFF